jgi:hypothetical protein
MGNINDRITDSNLYESPEIFYSQISMSSNNTYFPTEKDIIGVSND